MPDEILRVRVLVSGRVQGVFFRQETVRAARAAGVAGWVRNLPDGRVEAAFEGPPSAVQRMIRWMHAGPPLARVVGVETFDEPPEGSTGFRVAG